MSQRSAAEGIPVLPTRVGLIAGSAVLGCVALVVLMVMSSRPGMTFAGAIVFAAIFGVLMWLMLRRNQRRQLEGLPRVSGFDHNGSRAALLRGVFFAVVLTVIQAVVLALFSRVWSLDEIGSIAGGILLGLALWQLLEASDLRRWQEQNGFVLCVRADARCFALTGRQARAGLVAAVRDVGLVH